MQFSLDRIKGQSYALLANIVATAAIFVKLLSEHNFTNYSLP